MRIHAVAVEADAGREPWVGLQPTLQLDLVVDGHRTDDVTGPPRGRAQRFEHGEEPSAGPDVADVEGAGGEVRVGRCGEHPGAGQVGQHEAATGPQGRHLLVGDDSE